MTQLIDKKDVLEAVQALPAELDAETVQRCIEVLSNQPTVDAVPVRHGHWERHNTYHGDDVSGFIDPDWRCSECGEQANVNAWCMYDLTAFCPNCGARMDG